MHSRITWAAHQSRRCDIGPRSLDVCCVVGETFSELRSVVSPHHDEAAQWMRYSHFKCLLYSLPLGPREAAAFCVLAAALSGGPFAFKGRCRSQTATTSKGWQFLLLISPANADTAFAERVSSLVDATKKSDAGRLPRATIKRAARVFTRASQSTWRLCVPD